MSLRLKLLLLGLLTLTLPWAGCQYAREMESVLREGERQALLAMAKTIAASLQGRTRLLYRDETLVGHAPGPLDLSPVPLPGTLLLDGFAEDWPLAGAPWRTVGSAPQGDRLRVLAGTGGRFLYLLIEVRDRHVLYDQAGANPLEPAAAGDRLWLGYTDPAGEQRQLFVSGIAPGYLRARRIEARELGQRVAVEEPRVEGAWQPMAGGYRIELRLPLSMLGGRFGVLIDDRDRRGAPAVPHGTLASEDLAARGRLIAGTPELAAYLRQFAQPGVELVAATPAGTILAQVRPLPLAAEFGPDRGILSRLYRRLLDRSARAPLAPNPRPGGIGGPAVVQAAEGRAKTSIMRAPDGKRVVIAAAAPILDGQRRRVVGVLQVSQSADRWLLLRDRALTRLLNLTLAASALAVLAAVGIAARLALRLGRLKRASESALSRDGRVVAEFPGTGARDELGALARSFGALLGRLGEHTSYLRTLAGKLSHEIRTPLTIVRSSLENLESAGLSPEARVYLARAREGSERLNSIVVAMGAASRVEESIRSAERSRFDVAALIESTIEAYRTAFPQRRFLLGRPPASCPMVGAPELIVQMLDKLVENAVDFSAPGATIVVRLSAEEDCVRIEVENPGPRLPEETRLRVFESLWQSRSGSDGRPHFGLGLYIVRLIAEAHEGSASADNLVEGRGVRFTIRLQRGRSGDATWTIGK